MVQISTDYFHTCGRIIYEAIYNQYDELNSHTGVREIEATCPGVKKEFH